MPVTSLHLRFFISKTGTTRPMPTTLSLSSCDVMPVNDLWIKSVYTECRWPTSVCRVWLTCWGPGFLSGLTCIPPRKGCSSRFRGCFPTFLSFHLSPCSLMLFSMTFSVWDGCQSQDETNEMRISLENQLRLSPQSKPWRMRGSLTCTWNSEVTFDYLPSLMAVV